MKTAMQKISFPFLLSCIVTACGEGVLNDDKKRDALRVPLNDTGVNFYLDRQTFTRQLIPGTTVARYEYIPSTPATSSTPTQAYSQAQDAQTGRDVTEPMDFDGVKGFSFTKLDDQGNNLDPAATEWTCIKDNQTGLVWEKKSRVVSDLHYAADIYSWYDANANTNGGYSGQLSGFLKDTGGIGCGPVPNTGSQRKSMGDTQSFVTLMNSMQLCGFDDWRLPMREEIRSLVDYGATTEPLIDTNYFPSLHSRLHYWTAESNATNPQRAWGFHFQDGTSHTHPKDCPTDNQGYDNGVLVVRGPNAG